MDSDIIMPDTPQSESEPLLVISERFFIFEAFLYMKSYYHDYHVSLDSFCVSSYYSCHTRIAFLLVTHAQQNVWRGFGRGTGSLNNY